MKVMGARETGGKAKGLKVSGVMAPGLARQEGKVTG